LPPSEDSKAGAERRQLRALPARLVFGRDPDPAMSSTKRRPLSRALLVLVALIQLETVGGWSAPPPGSRPLKNLRHPRWHHTATLLENGNVLVFGGWFENLAVFWAEVINASTDMQWDVSPGVPARAGHTATALAPGEVLILGGYNGQETFDDALLYSYDPKNYNDPGSFRVLKDAHLKVPRAAHSATLLKDGCIVVVGGRAGHNTIEFVSKTPDGARKCKDAHPWEPTRFPHNGHTATLLGETLVLAGGGGTNLVDVYNLRTNEHRGFESPTIGGDQRATLLDDRHILFTGGNSYQKRAAAWPENSEVGLVHDNALAVARASHFAVALMDSRVALIGGASGSGAGPWGGDVMYSCPGARSLTRQVVPHVRSDALTFVTSTHRARRRPVQLATPSPLNIMTVPQPA
jgi:hypothetical protein